MQTPEGGGRYYLVGGQRLTEKEYLAQQAKQKKPAADKNKEQENVA